MKVAVIRNFHNYILNTNPCYINFLLLIQSSINTLPNAEKKRKKSKETQKFLVKKDFELFNRFLNYFLQFDHIFCTSRCS